MKLIDSYNCSCKKRAILMINVFEYCPRGYIEGGYYFFTRPSSAGIIRVWVLFEGGSYMRKYGILSERSQLKDLIRTWTESFYRLQFSKSDVHTCQKVLSLQIFQNIIYSE